MWKTVSRAFVNQSSSPLWIKSVKGRKRITNVVSFRMMSHSDTVTVNITQGALRGKQKITKSGFKFFSFRGIPYAKPPVGALRFKAPQPPESWSGVRDAFKEGHICPQKDMVLQEYRGNEDCLFLNVYTPKDPNVGGGDLKPVMVWFHGGGFEKGSGNSDIYGPDFLVPQDVVVITLNYRLGPFGFLCLDNEEVPGNAGLKDQVMALRWVQQNVKQFGGDPNNVTIFGESAGGASAHYHMLSPLSKGLFHRVISQSGTALCPWALSTSARERTLRLAKALGCETKDDQELLGCLQKAPAEKIVEVIMKSTSDLDKRQLVTFPFVPCVEKVKGPQEAFLSAHPKDLISAGQFYQVPHIIGLNSYEGLILLQGLKKAKLEKIDKDIQCLVPCDAGLKLDTEVSRKIGEQIRELYLGNKSITEKTVLQYADIQTDAWFAYKIFKTVKMESAVSSAPTFYYKFCFDGQLGMFKRLLGLEKYKGVCHADDIGYLFHFGMLDMDPEPDSPEHKAMSRFVKLWTNFAKTGNPTPERTELLDVVWKPVERNKAHCLKLDSELSLEESKDDGHLAFWDNVYDVAHQQKAKL